MSSNPNPDSRARLQELLAIPERDRTDAQWDEIHELEVQSIQIGNKPVHQNQKPQALVRQGDGPPRPSGPRHPGGPGGPGGPNRGRRDFQKKHRRRPKGGQP